MDLTRSRQEMKDLRLCERITKTLGGDGPQKVVLIGDPGIGKTRLAGKVGEHATKKGFCYLTLWLHLNKKFDDEWSLFTNIASQLEVEEDDGDDEEEQKLEDRLKNLKENISAELKMKKRDAEETRESMARWKGKKLAEEEKKDTYLLLILDDEGNKTSENTVMKELGFERFLIDYAPLKVLITRRKGDENTATLDNEMDSHAMDGTESDNEMYPHAMDGTESDNGMDSHAIDEIESDNEMDSHAMDETESEEEIKSHAATNDYEEIVFHTTDESQALLDSLTEDNIRDIVDILLTDVVKNLLGSLEKAWKIDEPLISRVVRKSMNLPAAVVVLAKSLDCITNQKNFKSLSPKQEKVLKEVLLPCEPVYSVSGYNPLIQLAYQLLETDDALKNPIVDCFWHSLDLFKHCGCVDYNDLITQWMLEGFFDPVISIKKAYMDAHDILVELINRGILKTQEDDMVIPEMAMSNLPDLRHHGLLHKSQVRFARVIGDDRRKGQWEVNQIDDIIKTVQTEKMQDIFTVYVSGNRLRRETSLKFFRQMAGLEVLVLFNPTVEPLIPALMNLLKLRVLVIRGCDLLCNIEELQSLCGLNVLEVSGASSVETISDEFFASMPELQTLNLSGLRIKHSPSSISQLKDLHSLILRDCPVLEDLPDVQNLEKLEVFDVRGARKLRTCFGMEDNTSRNQTFFRLRQLQLLDFSESKIRQLPLFHDAAVVGKLQYLTRVSLQNCSKLKNLPTLKPLSSLQILDLSGTTSLEEITEECLEQKEELKILNLSGTKITKLPSTISKLSNLSQLLLRDNSNLEAIPNITGLTSLEVFDISGCTTLHKIEGSFKNMSCLREVNLSGTKIETLPEFPEKSSIGCLKLVVLADSRRLTKDTWSQVEDAITNATSENFVTSDMVDRIQETSTKESGIVDELWAFDCLDRWEDKSHIYRNVYLNTIPFVDTKIQDVLEIHGSNGVYQDVETLAKVEYVAFVKISAVSLSSIFKSLKSVKGCWLEMSEDTEILFSGVDEERLGNLEILSVTSLGRLETICKSSIFQNLKKLSIDCCPCITTLFHASQEPTNLQVLEIKFCEKLEKVFEEEVELLSLHTLWLSELPVLSTIHAKLPNLETYKKNKCPNLETSVEIIREGY